MKRILLGFSLLLSLSLSAQSWQGKPVVRIQDVGQSFQYTFSDSSDAYINKCNVSYIVNMPNSQWVQLGYMYDGSTSRIITASFSAITQPDLGSAKELSDTLNAWLRDCAGTGGGGGGGASFIPNGVKLITESRELQADDAGYFLVITRDNTEVPPVILTIPDPSPLKTGESFAIINGADLIKDKYNGFRLGDTGSPICTPAINECVLFTTTNVEDVKSTLIVSSIIIDDGNEGNFKTALRYLMDNQGNLFPNGIEIVSSTRDFQASDVGKYLILLDGVGLTMPVSAPFIEKNKLIGVFAATTNFPCDNYFERIPGEKVYMYSAGYSAQNSNESLILLSGANFDDTQQTVAPANDAPIFINENDTVGYTSKRYLMDNSGNTGTATLVAGTVTVADARVKTGAKIIVSVDTPVGTQGFLSAPAASIVDETSFVINSSSNTETSTVNYWFVNP